MKLNKFILGLLFVVAGLLTSCDQDNVGAKYTPSTQNISFEMETPEQMVVKTSSVEIPIRVIRSLSESSYTAHYSISGNEDGYFSDPNNGSITFETGQTVCIIKLTAQDLEGGEEYECTLNLSEEDIATADEILNNAKSKTTIKVKRDFEWESLGVGHFTSKSFLDEWNVEVEKAVGINVYKMKDLFQTGADVIAKIKDDNTVEVKPQFAWTDNTYGKISVVGNYDGKNSGYAGVYVPGDKTIQMYLNHYVPSWGFVDGSYGTFEETLILP